MSLVDYEHILQILSRCANENKSAREAYTYIIFAFGDPRAKKEKKP